MSSFARVLPVLAILVCALPPPALAQTVAGAFSQGRTHLYVSGGAGSSFGESYVVIGAGVDYFLLDGLSAGLAFESWSGADPGFTKITPSVRYVFYGMQAVKPYVGAFYRRTDIDGRPSLDSVGGRAGVFVNLVPVFAAVLAVVLINEPFALFHAVALALVIGGIWLAQQTSNIGRAR